MNRFGINIDSFEEFRVTAANFIEAHAQPHAHIESLLEMARDLEREGTETLGLFNVFAQISDEDLEHDIQYVGILLQDWILDSYAGDEMLSLRLAARRLAEQ